MWWPTSGERSTPSRAPIEPRSSVMVGGLIETPATMPSMVMRLRGVLMGAVGCLSVLVAAAVTLAPTAAAATGPRDQVPAATTTVVGNTGGDSPVPSVATEGTTSTKAGATDDPAQDRLRYVIWGLVALAVLLTVLTVMLWRATSPARTVTVSEEDRPEIPEPPAPRRPALAAVAVDCLMAPQGPLPPEPPAS